MGIIAKVYHLNVKLNNFIKIYIENLGTTKDLFVDTGSDITLIKLKVQEI